MKILCFWVLLAGLAAQAVGWLRTEDGIWQSGSVPHGSAAELRRGDLAGESFMLFWRVSSEKNYDCFEIEADGKILLCASGTDQPWQYFAAEFPWGGEDCHELIFRFRRDGSGGDGENLAEIYGLSLGSWMPDLENSSWRYQVAGGKIMLKSCLETGKRVAVPGVIDGLEVAGLLPAVFHPGRPLSDISFEEGPCFLGPEVFRGQDEIEEIFFPRSLRFLGRGCLRDCRALRRIVFRGPLLAAGEECFMNCSSLEKLSFVRFSGTVPVRAFWGCASLRSLVIPEGIWKIGSSAFSGSGLCRIQIPASCRVIEERAMMNCPDLGEIRVAEDSEFLAVRNGALTDAPGRRLILYPPDRPEAVWQLPETVEAVCPYAFYGAVRLEKLILNRRLEVLPEHCLQNCGGLQELILPENLRFIGREALAGCSSLAHLILPRSLQQIEEMAFWGCSALEQLDFEGGCPLLPENPGCGDCVFLVWRGVGWEDCGAVPGAQIQLRGSLPPKLACGAEKELLFSRQHLVELWKPEDGIDWIYTLDGRTPKPGSGRRYQNPFPVTESGILRCRGFVGGMPASVEKQLKLVEMMDLPVEEETAFLTADAGEEGCCIEKYLGDRKAFRIPERLFGLTCRGVSAAAFAGKEGFRLAVLPDSLLWLELDGAPDGLRLSAASGDLAVYGRLNSQRLFFRDEYNGLLLLRPGWNLCAFPGSVCLQNHPRLQKFRPMVRRKNSYCYAETEILPGEGCWLWSEREELLAYAADRNEIAAAPKKTDDCWRLEACPSGLNPGNCFLWTDRNRWQRTDLQDCSGEILGWRIQTGR